MRSATSGDAATLTTAPWRGRSKTALLVSLIRWARWGREIRPHRWQPGRSTSGPSAAARHAAWPFARYGWITKRKVGKPNQGGYASVGVEHAKSCRPVR
jgi:hypothetical protein